MRSLDISSERLGLVLDLLVRAGHVLTESSDVVESLTEIAKLCTASFAHECTIRVLIEGLTADEFVVSSGTHPGRAVADQGRIVERLVAGRRSLGEITCLTGVPEGFDDAIVRAVQLLALQISATLSGYAATQREHDIADRLQRALLPDHLPSVGGVSLDAAYRPASYEAEVGGDWYDVFALADGNIAISVGDVAGHGIDAAVIMGEVRQAIRTAASGGEAPAAVLEYVNGVSRIRESDHMVTAIFGTYDPAGGALAYAVAGHPAPILSLGGHAIALPGGGIPLGCSDSVESVTWTFTIPAGARAVFYTDGLTENDRDPIAGEAKLIETIVSLPQDELAAPAEELLRRLFGAASNRDDAAVLMLTRYAPVAQYTFSALPMVSSLARGIVSRETAALQLSDERRFGLLVAIGEAIANAVEHGYRGIPVGLISMKLDLQPKQIVATIEDFGHWRPYVPREERGRGIELMHAFTDGVQIRSSRGSTTITLRTALTEDR